MAGGVKEQFSETVSKAKRRIGVEKPVASEEGGRVGIVRGALQAFGEGDMDAFLDAFKDEAPFECPSGKRFPGAGDHEGPDEVKETFIADVGRTYTEFGFEPETFIEADNDKAVIVFGSFVGKAADGDPLDTRGAQVWEFEGNTVAAVRIYADSADFAEVVSEQDLREEEEEEERKKEEERKGDDESSDDDEPRASADDSDDDESDESDDSDDANEDSDKSDDT
jgi:ketosteroid isomerase-like protein